MQLLTEQDIDISAFAGVRERIYIHDARQFGHQRLADAAHGIGACVYLADASLRPHRNTGLHRHRDIDIVTLVLNGELLHRGSLGDTQLLRPGDAMIQRAGAQGFSHDEINPAARFNRFLQLWLLPQRNLDAPAFECLTASGEGFTTLYCSRQLADIEHITTRVRWLVADQPLTLQLHGAVQLFIVAGDVKVEESSAQIRAPSSGLITAVSPAIEVAAGAMLLIIEAGVLHTAQQ